MRQSAGRLLLSLGLAWAWAGCGGCDEGDGVLLLEPSAQLSPLILDFGEVPLTVRVQGTVTLRSVGEVRLTIQEVVLADSSFFHLLGSPATELLPSLSDVIQVEATPTEVGLYETQLLVRTDDRSAPTRAVTVRLLAVPAPPCNDGNTCTEDWFDSEANDCRHRFADGLSCAPADRCIINAVCSQGVCLGASKTCDDGSVCTRDYCRQTDGECVFLPSPIACDDNNPCTADRCEGNGCLHEPLLNGEPCDDQDDCSRNDACFAGECVGSQAAEGSSCDDHDSCTFAETCQSGVCRGTSMVESAPEGTEIFSYNLTPWPSGAFLHRREVSLSDQGVFYGLDHLRLANNEGLTHVVFAMNQCPNEVYQFSYRPPDAHVLVSYVRRAMQLNEDARIRMVVGVRQRFEDGFEPQTTTYVLDPQGQVLLSGIQTLGGETGRSLLPDGSYIYGLVWPITSGAPTPEAPAVSNLVIVREDATGNVLWRHERSSGDWAEFLGVAGPRVLFWASGRFGALDFNTGALVWSQETGAITKEMALSTPLNLGVARTSFQLIGVEILSGQQIFTFPAAFDPNYVPRTDPVIAPDGRILVLMERRDELSTAVGLEWVELNPQGEVLATTVLDYTFPDWSLTRHEDQDDPYPTVADDGIAYVGYGDRFWALDPGGQVRWVLTSTVPSGFTGTVPLLRDDGVMLISKQSRQIIGVRTNGGQMSSTGWASFRHDGRRTNFTP